MDAILNIAKKAQGGDSEALKELKLDSLDDPVISEEFEKYHQKSYRNAVRNRYTSAIRSSPVPLKLP